MLGATTGCIPGITWLPDSSGFVYTTGGLGDFEVPPHRHGGLFVFDVKQKKPVELVPQTGTHTLWPALRADGQRIAVAGITYDKEKAPALEVIVYDRQGKEVQVSRRFEWGNPPPGVNPSDYYTQLFWAPRGNKVLVFANRTTGIVDLEANRVIKQETGCPAIFGTSPVRPDGQGFLLTRANADMAFVDWDGGETAIDMKPETRDSNDKRNLLYTPVASCWSRWEGDTAVATWDTSEIRIDTAKHLGTFHTVAREKGTLDGKEIYQEFTFPGGKTRIVVVYVIGPRDFRDAGLPVVRVDLLGPGANERRTLVHRTSFAAVFPAPNRELAALRYYTETGADKKKHVERIAVVNAKGEVAAQFDLNP
jgi:hypothetical protein